MQQDNAVFYNPMNELEDDLNVNYEKLLKTIWSRRFLLIKVFCLVLAFFVSLTFILPKKYKVTADLYINKTNNSNMLEVNPYAIDEVSGAMLSLGTDKSINNEIEIIKSELVLDKVIRDNNITYKKIFGIFPNKKYGELMSAKDFYGKGKKLKLENVKNSTIINIEYRHKEPDIAYGVVSSLIANYIELHKELNSEKSKSDKKLLESEYNKTKEILEKKLNQSSGLPVQSMTGIGNLSAMSAFSKSASQAMGNIRNQYLAGEKSQIAISEESQKLNQLATKLEWAKMVEQVSDSSKVLILNEPHQLRPFEKDSPKLLKNILFGVIFGIFTSFIALIYAEKNDKTLTYSMIGNNVIYNSLTKDNVVKTEIIGYAPSSVLIVLLENLPQKFILNLQQLPNAEVTYSDLSTEFTNKVAKSEYIIIVSKIRHTSTEHYKLTKSIINKQRKDIVCDILI